MDNNLKLIGQRSLLVKRISASCRFEHINHKVVLIGDSLAAIVYALAKMLEIYANHLLRKKS